MLAEIKTYLDEVRSHLHLQPQTQRRVLSELYSHFQEKMAELERQGLGEAQAAREAVRCFGRARVVARLMDEAYGQGSWLEALIIAQPHLIAASLFATHFWQQPLFVAGAFGLLLCPTLLAWRSGKASWLYSWAAYSLAPLLGGAYISRHFAVQSVSFLLQGRAAPIFPWLLLPLAGLYIFTLWLLAYTTLRAVRKDWLFASLMLIPLPILGIWLFHVERTAALLQVLGADLHRWDSAMASIFLVLALASAVFIRLRPRVLKAGAVLAIGSIGAAAVVRAIWSDISLLGLLAIALLLLVFFWSPMVLKAKLAQDAAKKEHWLQDLEGWAERPSAAR